MLAHGTMKTIDKTLQQRLQWKPAKGEIFRFMNDFVDHLNVYSFATGKRYFRGKVDNKRNEAKFVCKRCRRGYVYLRIRRFTVKYHWHVKVVKTCDCGTPSDLLTDVESNNFASLVGRRVQPKSDWKLMAAACFPRGHSRDKSSSSRRWCISCKRENCNGQIKVETQWVKKEKYNAFTILSAVGCSKECGKIDDDDDIILAIVYL